MNTLNENISEKIADNLVKDGYIILDNVLDNTLVEGLYKEISAVENFNDAKIGRGIQRQYLSSTRSDKTLWLEGKEENERAYLEWMESLKIAMNKELYLGLAKYEAHFSYYEQGSFYQKHVDVLKGSNKRLLTTVFYLTKDWKEGDGGELLIYDEEGENIIQRVPPRIGTMVIFLSSKFPHEVLPSRIDRYSIAGWFKGL